MVIQTRIRELYVEAVEIRVLSSSVKGIPAQVLYGPSRKRCHMLLRYDGREVHAAADDYFEALVTIRRQLEAQGLIPVCYGASRNVFPSGMCRDMGAGLQAYKFALGRKPTMDDLVLILSTGPDIEPATVEEQRMFFESWLDSVGVK